MENQMQTNIKNGSILSGTSKSRFLLYLQEIILSLGVIAILVPIIVDVSINRELTWSTIVGCSVLYTYSGFTAFFVCKKRKLLISLATYSILLIPYLFGLETLIDHFYLEPSQDRFVEYALPISLIWLVIVWSVILFGEMTKINHCYRISILFLLAIVGTGATNAIACKISWIETFHDFEQMIEVLEFIGCAIFFFFVGTFRKINKRVA